MNTASVADCLDLARQLIMRPSLTPDDAGCLELIGARLVACGFSLERMDCNGVANLWAVRAGSVALPGAPLLCFAGHTDVVPPGPLEQWRFPPFAATVSDGLLYGRGAADMKSSIAAFVCACESLHIQQQRGTLALLLTSDEEGDAVYGSAHVVEQLRQRGTRIDYCLVGEPTSSERFGDTCKIGRRGSLSARLQINGVQGHVAYPERVRNAVHLALPALQRLATTVWDEGDEHFPPTSLQISNLHAGTGAGNVAPGLLQADFNLRFAPVSTAALLQQRVENILNSHKLQYAITWTLGAQPFVSRRGQLAQTLSAILQEQCAAPPLLSTSGGTSDGRFLIHLCPEVIEFGPRNDSIHKVDEHVALDELGQLSKVYAALLQRLVT